MDPGGHDDRGLPTEQVAYYRAAAGEYFDHQLDEPGGDELAAAVERFAPSGDVLELACGPGTWTPLLLRRADTITAVDASPEMQALARERLSDDLGRVRFVLADLFEWSPDRHLCRSESAGLRALADVSGAELIGLRDTTKTRRGKGRTVRRRPRGTSCGTRWSGLWLS